MLGVGIVFLFGKNGYRFDGNVFLLRVGNKQLEEFVGGLLVAWHVLVALCFVPINYYYFGM